MIRPVGYYVHHQGAGHRHRARNVAAALGRPCTLIGTFGDAGGEDAGAGPVLDLPDDRREGVASFAVSEAERGKPEAFHYAPVGNSGVRRRMARLASWIVTADPVLMVVDVSVEMTLFARLMSIPAALVRLTGSRLDTPHLEAFRSAALLLAPFPAVFESPDTPVWVRDKTYYGGFLARPASGAPAPGRCRTVAVVFGRGGAMGDASGLDEAARATPDVAWHVYGPVSGHREGPPNLFIHGWRTDIGKALDDADTVVGAAGDGLLAEVAVRAKRFICLPEERPFHEQRDKGRTLAAHGMAVVLDTWPSASAWPDILRRADDLDPRTLHALTDPLAIEKFAAAIEALAARC
jgi:hypothetical protein